MIGIRAFLARLALIVIAIVLETGCASGSVRGDSGRVSNLQFGPFIKMMTTVYPGPLDQQNRFLPVVGVKTPANKSAESCSGVLIAPRLVLTAAHCVCLTRALSAEDKPKVRAAVGKTLKSAPVRERDAVWRAVLEGADTIVDGSSCAPLSIVTVITYPPVRDGDASQDAEADLSFSAREYRSQSIRPHDDFMIVYDGRVTNFKEADLAFIVLNKPIKIPSPGVRLATVPVARGDRVVMVGYGLGETGKPYGDRHWAASVVVQVNTSDSANVQFDVRELPKDGGVPSGTYVGDSGGPCFSESDDRVLVGISTAVTSDDPMKKRSVFTSIYPHGEWARRVAREVGEELH